MTIDPVVGSVFFRIATDFGKPAPPETQEDSAGAVHTTSLDTRKLKGCLRCFDAERLAAATGLPSSTSPRLERRPRLTVLSLFSASYALLSQWPLRPSRCGKMVNHYRYETKSLNGLCGRAAAARSSW